MKKKTLKKRLKLLRKNCTKLMINSVEKDIRIKAQDRNLYELKREIHTTTYDSINKKYINLKTNEEYELYTTAINATNGDNEGKTMIIYFNENNVLFATEIEEFNIKFKEK